MLRLFPVSPLDSVKMDARCWGCCDQSAMVTRTSADLFSGRIATAKNNGYTVDPKTTLLRKHKLTKADNRAKGSQAQGRRLVIVMYAKQL